MLNRNGYECVPAGLLDGIDRWVSQGTPPCGFLEAVLRNNLAEAVAYADIDSAKALKPLLMYLVNQCPRGCWGSDERLKAWAAEKRRRWGRPDINQRSRNEEEKRKEIQDDSA